MHTMWHHTHQTSTSSTTKGPATHSRHTSHPAFSASFYYIIISIRITSSAPRAPKRNTRRARGQHNEYVLHTPTQKKTHTTSSSPEDTPTILPQGIITAPACRWGSLPPPENQHQNNTIINIVLKRLVFINCAPYRGPLFLTHIMHYAHSITITSTLNRRTGDNNTKNHNNDVNKSVNSDRSFVDREREWIVRLGWGWGWFAHNRIVWTPLSSLCSLLSGF